MSNKVLITNEVAERSETMPIVILSQIDEAIVELKAAYWFALMKSIKRIQIHLNYLLRSMRFHIEH